MKNWILYRKRTYEELLEEVNKNAITIGGETFTPRVDPYVGVMNSNDFSEIAKYMEEHHDDHNHWKLSAVEIGCRTCAEEELDRKLLNESVGYIGEAARKARKIIDDEAWKKWKEDVVIPKLEDLKGEKK